jgi:large repetitive protein
MLRNYCPRLPHAHAFMSRLLGQSCAKFCRKLVSKPSRTLVLSIEDLEQRVTPAIVFQTLYNGQQVQPPISAQAVTSEHITSASYATLGGSYGIANLSPLDIQTVGVVSPNFTNTLNADNNGFQLNYPNQTPQNINQTVTVRVYDAQANVNAVNSISAGAKIVMTANLPPGNGWGWIQVITTNSPLNAPLSGIVTNSVDKAQGNVNNPPFYPNANVTGFEDLAQRDMATLQSYNWSAEVHLAQVNGNTITVYPEGMTWGVRLTNNASQFVPLIQGRPQTANLVAGQPITLTARVFWPFPHFYEGFLLPPFQQVTGTVNFYDQTNNNLYLGSGTLRLEDGVPTAAINALGLATGLHTIRAVYQGDGPWRGVSTTFTQGVPGGMTRLDSISPAFGSTLGNQWVLLNGSGFLSAGISSVTFGTNDSSYFYVANDTTIYALTPPDAPATTDVILATASGLVDLPGAYTFSDTPDLTLSTADDASMYGTAVTFTPVLTAEPELPGVFGPWGIMLSDIVPGVSETAISDPVVPLGDPIVVSGLSPGVHHIQATYWNTSANNYESNVIDEVVLASPTITSDDNTTFTAGNSGSFTVTSGTTDEFPLPNFSVIGDLPAGTTLVSNSDGSATLEGTPTARSGGVYTFTIVADNGTGTDDTQTFTLTVNQAPKFVGPSQATFAVGEDDSVTIGTRGYPNASITESGTLPSGVSAVDNGDGTFTISGTTDATYVGTYSLTLTAHNGIGSDATRTFTLTVAMNATQTSITNVDSSPTPVNSEFDVSVSVSGPGAGAVSVGSVKLYADAQYLGEGTPDGDGNVTIAVTSGLAAGGLYELEAVYVATGYETTYAPSSGVGSIEIDEAPSFVSPDTTEFDVGTGGAFLVETAGYPTASLSITSGSLPTGLTFTDNTDGTATITGTTSVIPGVYPITITADDGNGHTTTQTLNIGVGTFVVDSSADPDALTPGTLRYAIASANAEAAAGISSTIVFAGISEVDLTQGPLELTAGTTGTSILIDGGGTLTIDGDHTHAAIIVDSGATVALSNLTITNGGSTDVGTGIDNSGALVLTDVTANELTNEAGSLNTVDTVSISMLTIDAGTLGISGTLDSTTADIETDLIWTADSGNGTIAANQISMASGTTLTVSDGALTLNDELGSFSGDSMALGDVIISGGTLTLLDIDSEIASLSQSGGTLIALGPNVTGSAGIDVTGGTLTFEYGFTMHGNIVVDDPSGTVTFGDIGGTNTLEVDDGTVNIGNLAVGWDQVDVNGGTLNVDGGIGFANNFNVYGGTLNINQFTEPVNVTIYGGTLGGSNTLAVGGVFTVSGGEVMMAGGLQLYGSVSLDSSVEVNLGGGLAINSGATLDATVPDTLSVGDTVTLISAGSISGTFDGLPEGAAFDVGPYYMQISYLGGYVTLTDVGLSAPDRLVVTRNDDPYDPTPGTLRYATSIANLESSLGLSTTIVFSGVSEVDLAQGPLELTAGTSGAGVVIDGGSGVTIDGVVDSESVLIIDSNATVGLQNLTITNGDSTDVGSGIDNSGTLTLADMTANELTNDGGSLSISDAATIYTLTINDGALGISGTLESSSVDLESDLVWTSGSGTGAWQIGDVTFGSGVSISATGGDLTVTFADAITSTMPSIAVSGGTLSLEFGSTVSNDIPSISLSGGSLALTPDSTLPIADSVSVSGGSLSGSLAALAMTANGDVVLTEFDFSNAESTLTVTGGTVQIYTLDGAEASSIEVDGGTFIVGYPSGPWADVTINGGTANFLSGVYGGSLSVSGGTLNLFGTVEFDSLTVTGGEVVGVIYVNHATLNSGSTTNLVVYEDVSINGYVGSVYGSTTSIGMTSGTVTCYSTGTMSEVTVSGGDLTLSTGTVQNLYVSGGSVTASYSLASSNFQIAGGELNVSGDLDIDSASEFDVADAVSAGGTATVGGTLTVSSSVVSGLSINDTVTLIHAGDINGTFDGLAESSTFTLGGYTMQISYVGGVGGHDVTLTRVS